MATEKISLTDQLEKNLVFLHMSFQKKAIILNTGFLT